MFMITKFRRLLFFLFCDFFIFLFSVYFANLLRFSGEIPQDFEPAILKMSLILVPIKLALMYIFGLYRVPWRFFGLNEARKIALVMGLGALIFYLIFSLWSDFFNPFARSTIIIDFLLSCVMVGTLRILKRVLLDFTSFKRGKPCVIIGGTNKALQVLNGFKSGYASYYCAGITDPREQVIGTDCGGYRVKSMKELKFYASQGIKSAIIAKKLSQNELSALYNDLRSFGYDDIKIFTLLGENESKIKDISIEDLLARKPKDLDKEIIKNYINSKIILITGAGGTIGSELCKLCLEFGAKKLIMLDHSEYNLYAINEATNADTRNVLALIDICNQKDLERIIFTHRPDIVFHAAAYKHVPLCEYNAISAVKNNILGTKNLIDLAIKYAINRVVLISTDKAVRPTNVMGATKRICELYALNSSSHTTQITGVRFGNVLGSSGSVIPKFQAQIAKNQALSVTHPQITRYFMLKSEACELVLQAGSIARGGELFVLDMGEPVKIADLAKRILELSGKENLGINYIGLRPGEKLYEELLIDPKDVKTRFESIFVTHSKPCDLKSLNEKISLLLSFDEANESFFKTLKDIVPEFNHAK